MTLVKSKINLSQQFKQAAAIIIILQVFPYIRSVLAMSTNN